MSESVPGVSEKATLYLQTLEEVKKYWEKSYSTPLELPKSVKIDIGKTLSNSSEDFNYDNYVKSLCENIDYSFGKSAQKLYSDIQSIVYKELMVDVCLTAEQKQKISSELFDSVPEELCKDKWVKELLNIHRNKSYLNKYFVINSHDTPLTFEKVYIKAFYAKKLKNTKGNFLILSVPNLYTPKDEPHELVGEFDRDGTVSFIIDKEVSFPDKVFEFKTYPEEMYEYNFLVYYPNGQ
jgi:hypothetical protein